MFKSDIKSIVWFIASMKDLYIFLNTILRSNRIQQVFELKHYHNSENKQKRRFEECLGLISKIGSIAFNTVSAIFHSYNGDIQVKNILIENIILIENQSSCLSSIVLNQYVYARLILSNLNICLKYQCIGHVLNFCINRHTWLKLKCNLTVIVTLSIDSLALQKPTYQQHQYPPSVKIPGH